MKTKLLSALLSLICLTVYSQTEEAKIEEIRKKYKDTRTNYSSYTKKTKDLTGESTEGGEAISFSKGKEIKLIEVTWNGETGKRTIEYYYSGGQLYFAFEQIHTYNAPIYFDEQTAKENGMEPFDPKKTTVKSNRYYFYNKELIRWLDNDKKKVDVNSEHAVGVYKDMLYDANEKLEKMKK